MDTQGCSNHKKEIAGISDMKELATLIGDLHYETLADLLDKVSDKLYLDAAKDRSEGRKSLARDLEAAANSIHFASIEIESAWEVSKPFMDNNQNPQQ